MKRQLGILLSSAAVYGWLAAAGWSKDGGDVVDPPLKPRVEAPSVVRKPRKQIPPPTAERLERWLKDLDSNEFLVRETATENLIAAGATSIKPLQGLLAEKRSLEVTTRSLFVLQQLALGEDWDTVDAARTVLDDLAAKDDTATGRRAANVVITINEQRSVQSLAELQQLGANVVRGQAIDANGGLVETIESIEIGTSWNGTNDDLRRLKWLNEVERLVLVGEKIGDEALQHIVKMQQLRSFHAYHAKLTDEGLQAVAGMNKLQEIGIYYVPISDAAIEPLAAVKALTSVKLYGTNATKEAVAKLQEALGLGKIDYRNGAFLGIGCDTLNGQCAISTVHQNSPADKAGLRQEDLLLEFDGQKVADFQGLTALISNYRAGDTVDVAVQRYVITEDDEPALQKLTLKVTLGEWDVSLFLRGR